MSVHVIRQDSEVPDCRLFVYDLESDEIHLMDFENLLTGLLDSIELNAPLSNASEEAKALATGRCPLSHFWDKKEPKLLISECARVRGSGSGLSSGEVSPRNAAPESKVRVFGY